MSRYGLIIFIVLSSVYSAVFSSCTDRKHVLDDFLNRAEILMESYCDSSYLILTDSIQPDLLTSASDGQKALYALLISQANHKCGIFEKDDSVISTAVHYFALQNDRYHLMKSFFYQAVIRRASPDYDTAIIPAMHAFFLSKELEDVYWQGRTAELLCHILSSSYSEDEALKYAELASEFYNKGGYEDFYIFSIVDKIHSLNCLNRFGESREIVEELEHDRIEDRFFRSYLSKVAMKAYSGLNDDFRAELWADSLLKYRDCWEAAATIYANIADVKISIGKLEEGKMLIDSAYSCACTIEDSIFIRLAELNLYKAMDSTKDAYAALQDVFHTQNRILDERIRQSVVKAQRDYYEEEAAISEARAERSRLYIIGIIIFSGMVVSIILLIYRNRINSKKSELNAKITELLMISADLKNTVSLNQSLLGQLTRQQSDLIYLSRCVENSKLEQDKLQVSLRQLLNGHFTYLDILVSEYAKKDEDNSPHALNALYKNLKAEIDKFNSPKSLSRITEIVNKCKDNLIEKMVDQIPLLKPMDITFITLTFAGFSAKSIGFVLGMKANSTYNKKHNLIKLIERSDAVDKDWFLKELGK